MSENAQAVIREAWKKSGLEERWKLIEPLNLSPEALTALQKGKLLEAPKSHSGLRAAMKAAGKEARAGMVNPIAHHDLPWAFRDFFAARGINCNESDFGR